MGLRAELRRRLTTAHAAAASSQRQEQPVALPLRVAVIGGGFAGLAAAYHLLTAAGSIGRAMELTLYDAVGLGAGGSGAAAGLLHPYTPRGKVRCEAMVSKQSSWRV